MGFHERWIYLSFQCISTVKYLINVKGSIVGEYHPLWGLWQGDPISLYLFLLCGDDLSLLIRQAKHKIGRIWGVTATWSSLGTSYLFFVDDSLLFCETSMV